MGSIRIENERLLLRLLEDHDLDGLIALRNDTRVYRYEPTFLAELQGTPEEALRTIQEMDLYRDGQFIFGVFEKNDPVALAGLAELYDFKPAERVVSIGCRLRSGCWGRGLASGCVRALLEFIRCNTEAKRVTAHAIPDNKASSRCLVKNGFHYLLTKTEDWGYGQATPAEVYVREV